MSAELRARVAAFLANHRTMTLATIGPDGQPHAAALFYAPDADLNLYFLSDPYSRHGLDLAREPRAAVTIHADGQDWQGIQGLQAEGRAARVEGELALRQAVASYAARFPFLAGLREVGQRVPAELAGPLARSRFYVLRPFWIRLINNRVRFGHKEELWLADQAHA